MNAKELKVERCKLAILNAESKAREAENNLKSAQKRHQAQIEQLKSETECEASRLKEEFERAKLLVELYSYHLKNGESDLEKGFE